MLNGIVGSAHSRTEVDVRRFARKAPERTFCIDGEDDPFIRRMYSYCSQYFKRELAFRDRFKVFGKGLAAASGNFPRFLADLSIRSTTGAIVRHDGGNDKIAPLNLSLISHEFDIWQGDKLYDISLVAGATSHYRKGFARLLKRFSLERGLKTLIHVFRGSIQRLDWKEYVRIVQTNRISVALPGIGFDTQRYWEIPFYGSVLAAPRLPIVIRDNFVDMESAIIFDSFQGFQRRALELLRGGSWADIQSKGMAHFGRYHTSLMRAKTVLLYLGRS